MYLGLIDSGERRLVVNAGSTVYYAEPGFLFFNQRPTIMAAAFNPGNPAVLGSPVPVADRVFTHGYFHGASFSVSRNGTLAYRAGKAGTLTELVWLDRRAIDWAVSQTAASTRARHFHRMNKESRWRAAIP